MSLYYLSNKWKSIYLWILRVQMGLVSNILLNSLNADHSNKWSGKHIAKISSQVGGQLMLSIAEDIFR